MITLTDKAICKLKEFSEAEGIGHLSVRIKVIGGGCSGFAYDMCFDDQSSDMDESFEKDGITVLVDALSWQYLEGVEVDYLESPISSGFKFNNPNVKGVCGCGSSFSA